MWVGGTRGFFRNHSCPLRPSSLCVLQCKLRFRQRHGHTLNLSKYFLFQLTNIWYLPPSFLHFCSNCLICFFQGSPPLLPWTPLSSDKRAPLHYLEEPSASVWVVSAQDVPDAKEFEHHPCSPRSYLGGIPHLWKKKNKATLLGAINSHLALGISHCRPPLYMFLSLKLLNNLSIQWLSGGNFCEFLWNKFRMPPWGQKLQFSSCCVSQGYYYLFFWSPVMAFWFVYLRSWSCLL